MPRRFGENGFLIVRDNSERCRDCGEDQQNIWYEDLDEVTGKVTARYALCKRHDTERVSQ